MKFKPICGIHDLIVHDYGPGRVMISLHAEVPGNIDIFDLHMLRILLSCFPLPGFYYPNIPVK